MQRNGFGHLSAMNKRKSCAHNVVKPSKTTRTDGKTHVQDEEEVDEEDGVQQDHSLSSSCAGDIGVIESITLRNFMSHHSLGPFKFGPNVNFIVGNNGTGKSAILTALIVGLGGKATTTNRGTSLKGFVKYGESSADIKVKLKNRGNDPYKGDIYGDSICIEHRISSDGCRTCKIKSKMGHVISTKKEELTAILDHFGIQVDNPVSVLNQEMSKQFLHSKSEADKYKFFMKATLLEQMKRDYIHIKQTKALTRDQVERQEENKVSTAEKRLQDIQLKLCTLREEQEQLAEESHKMKEEIKVKTKAQKNQEVVYFRAENKLKQLEKEQCLLQERIHKISHGSGRRSHETEHAQHLKKISAFKTQLEKLETESSALNQEIKDKQQALFKGREEYDKLSMEEKNIQVSLEFKLKRKKQLMASRSNRLKRFGDHMPELLELIDKAFAQGRFVKKPVGPIGACISLKDPSLAVAVESCLLGFIKTFCCDNYRDEKVLQGLMSSYFPNGSRPQIIVCPFTDRVYNVQGRGVHHPEFPSVLDCLNAENPVIINCLIDMRGIECILVIKDHARARKVMQGSTPPRNCREAFTAGGDHVYYNRSYTPNNEVLVKYLGGDPEAEIRLVESELENNQAQLLRFQLHLSSVKEDIQFMEEKLRSVIRACKKNQQCINEVKASITELENIEEAQAEDISSLEEDAQENEQKIESERKNVKEARDELKNHEKGLMNINQKYKDVKNKMEQLSDETEQLKEEQVKAETVCSKLDQTMKVLEKKLEDHQANIQAMRDEVSIREEETLDCEAKAKEICPVRQQVDQSARSIDVEITRLRQKITTQESSHGDKEQVIREYAEAHSNYKSKSSQLRDLRKFIDRLDNIMIDRQDRYKSLRRSLSVRCKLYFNNFMMQLHCCGSMIFDHITETLSISVKPPGQERNNVSDMRSLSGGERSFSTVCFILALWEITESPFRCLDEFDVYMDMHNRSISMNMLVALSERQHLRQFIFITPQSTSHLPKSANITIHQLQDPEKVAEEE
ncbi:structural maintenance of chromosomes protein 6 isoform X2 [Rhinichthys klamathensis goyatoka]|uniref:structural maintenance of chromosomes protein 6 isoform X2 n=1 Tax=Rhinichthys klamathensis goyatoka TaxID=3034132 RepID=UPI0024B61296|nr:structural maintenance of chromosomes protein 6 isoform X2 [Rhinichthys klamathensis goyatoka]